MIRIGMSLAAIATFLSLVGCASGLTPDNVKGRVVAALEREDQIATIQITIRPTEEVPDTIDIAWLDLPGRRGRVEYSDGTIRVAGTGMTGDWKRTGSETSLLERRYSTLRTAPDTPAPPPVNNPALTVIQPLLSALLWPEPWTALGEREWNGRRVSAWGAAYPFTESNEAQAEIYLDPDTGLPVGQELILPAGDGPGSDRFNITYEVTFAATNLILDESFDVVDMREHLLGYGTHQIGGPKYRKLWLGRQVEAGEELPELTLRETVVSEVRGEEFTKLTYHVLNRIPVFITAHFGLMRIFIRPRDSWDRYALNHEDRWWESALRESVLVSGLPTEYSTQSGEYAEAIVWFRDIVVTMEAKPLTDPLPPEFYGGDDPRPPGFDRNEFNTEAALAALIPFLVPIR